MSALPFFPRLLCPRYRSCATVLHLIVDGKLHQTWSPNRLAVELVAQPELHGKHFVYFHLVQSDGNQAWSSPIWLDDGDQDTGERE